MWKLCECILIHLLCIVMWGFPVAWLRVGGTAAKLLLHRGPHSEHYTPYLPLPALLHEVSIQTACAVVVHVQTHAHLCSSVPIWCAYLWFFFLLLFKWELIFFFSYFPCQSVLFFLFFWKCESCSHLRKMPPLGCFNSWVSRNASSRRVFKIKFLVFVVRHHCSLLTLLLG